MYIAFYVYNLIIGDVGAIDKAITALKENGFVLKVVEGLQDHLFWEVKFLKNKKRA